MSLGVALIGTGFMGKCHAMAWRNVATVFGGTPPRLEVLADASAAADQAPPAQGAAPGEKEDSALALIRFASGAHGSFATSRVARGRKCRLQWEIHGSEGALVVDREHMNKLWVHRAGEAGFTRHLTGPDLIRPIAGGAPCAPSFAGGLQIERIIHGLARSAGRPVKLEPVHEDA